MAVHSRNNTPPASPRSWRTPAMALALAPVAAVVVMRFLAPIQGPATARAAGGGGGEQTALVIPPAQQPTAAQIELARVMEEEASRPFGPSPVVSRKRLADVESAGEALPQDPTEAGIPDAPDLPVTSIMVAQEQTLAVIDGTLHKVGDVVAPEWTITSISRAEGTVTITHTRGRVHQLVLRQRGSR